MPRKLVVGVKLISASIGTSAPGGVSLGASTVPRIVCARGKSIVRKVLPSTVNGRNSDESDSSPPGKRGGVIRSAIDSGSSASLVMHMPSEHSLPLMQSEFMVQLLTTTIGGTSAEP